MQAGEVESQSKRLAPGPRAWPLVGNLGALLGLIPFLEQQWACHGDVIRVRILGLSALVLVHPDSVQRVLLTNRHNYIKGGAYDSLRKILGNGLLTLEGDAWKERRTLAQPAFHRQALEKLTAIMAESGARFFDELEVKLRREPGVFELHEAMVRLTLDVVINALFGRSTLESSAISYEAIGHLLELLSSGANGVPLPAWVPTPGNLKFQRTMRVMNTTVFTIIAAARGRQSEGTLLSMLLAARDAHGQALSDQALRDEVITLFVAGHETTALTLSWLFVLLEHEPEVMARMREEVDSVLGGGEPSFEDLPKLVYVRQVIDEALRLRPPAPMVARDVLGDDQLGGYAIGSGDIAMPFIWGVHRHPDFWKDPMRFDPERFAPSAIKGRHVGSYLPFSLGPRICIGNAFSLIETTLLLAQMLNRFDIEILSCAGVLPKAVGTVRPSKPVRVRFTPRRKAA